MRRGRHNAGGFRTGADAAQPPAEPTGTGAAGTAGSTGTRAGAAETETTGAGLTTATGPTTAGLDSPSGMRPEQPAAPYQRGTAPAAAYQGEAVGADVGVMAGGVLSVVAGLLTFLAGLAAVVRQHFYPTLAGYAYSWNVRDWGIILLVLGVLLFAAGACTLLGMGWARAVGVGIAILTAVAGFLFLAYAPIWGVIIVAVSVIAIWGLLHDGAGRRELV
jgi:hypothetical protein